MFLAPSLGEASAAGQHQRAVGEKPAAAGTAWNSWENGTMLRKGNGEEQAGAGSVLHQGCPQSSFSAWFLSLFSQSESPTFLQTVLGFCPDLRDAHWPWAPWYGRLRAREDVLALMNGSDLHHLCVCVLTGTYGPSVHRLSATAAPAEEEKPTLIDHVCQGPRKSMKTRKPWETVMPRYKH